MQHRELHRHGRGTAVPERRRAVGVRRNVMASVTADRTGAYTMNMGRVTSSLLARNQCKVVVVTPLAACNASLANITGTLAAPVQLVSIGADLPINNDAENLIGGIV
ncbi:hypothetical protein CFC21_091321 [Triticum aestivum]|nr:uncharacterized protein LOC109785345 [Aegilops tauschii subsp. strangulata]XP_044416145.1 uncharacterized protein LOC123140952 [Triticum aestivum]KAF7088186.1 hypothetical protein CFC21_091321 [Triticum aestivum]